MALIGSLTSGVSALKSFSKGIEVIGNNIANVNTAGFKGQRTEYGDSFYNMLRRSGGSQGTSGSNTTAAQIGSGVQAMGISSKFTQGPIEATGVPSDLAIIGDGFFRVRDSLNDADYVTRSGNFRIDDNGFVVNQQGFRLQGLDGGMPSFTATQVNGQITFARGTDTAPGAVGDLRIPNIQDGNGITIADSDSDGISDFLRVDNMVEAAWDTSLSGYSGPYRNAIEAAVLANPADAAAARTALEAAILDANYSGSFRTEIETATAANPSAPGTAQTDAQTAVSGAGGTPAEQSEAGTFAFDIVEAQMAAEAAITAGTTSGSFYSVADLEKLLKVDQYEFDQHGNLQIMMSNGETFTAGQSLLMDFNDPQALVRSGNGLFTGFDAAGSKSGTNILSAADNTPGIGGLGSIKSNALELSNVDLTEEFSNMITVQRSFQAGSRLVTVSDDLLQEIVNLKR